MTNTTTGDRLTAGTDYTWSAPTLTLLGAYLNNANTHKVVGGSNTLTLTMNGGTNPTITETISAGWYNAGYLYRKALTIDHTKVSGGSLVISV